MWRRSACGAGGGSDPASDLEKPWAERLPDAERSRLTGQDEERGLKGVFGIVPIVQDGLTRVEDHRAVALDQGSEAQFGHLAVAAREPVQKLPVGQLPGRPGLEDRLNEREE